MSIPEALKSPPRNIPYIAWEFLISPLVFSKILVEELGGQ